MQGERSCNHCLPDSRIGTGYEDAMRHEKNSWLMVQGMVMAKGS
jgi:hypothetical protein